MTLGSDLDVARLAISVLDLTDLGDDTTAEAAAVLCERARAASVAAVCVWPRFVPGCVAALDGTPVRVATVVDFPSGAEPLDDVVEQTAGALRDGANEIDVVLPYRALLAGDTAAAADVLDAVCGLVTDAGAHMKVIIESGELPDLAAVADAAQFAIAHGADFVKTSTGKTPVSATPDAAETILEAIRAAGGAVGFKASGGIRTLADARTYLEIAERVMGEGWATPATFRFGASGLLDALQSVR
ncbi:deoxyribose-phosphate aldolase [Desertimonas flava]|uniref:deoxyribose-phosphate aldolase n=1 Tax=Desertimonas flava TaxID=2064846 RepID=UPI000E34396E|nr:deoxyribose-phosphate aldolase [Desertimonas flava]